MSFYIIKKEKKEWRRLASVQIVPGTSMNMIKIRPIQRKIKRASLFF
jgi:hypothetical protein